MMTLSKVKRLVWHDSSLPDEHMYITKEQIHVYLHQH